MADEDADVDIEPDLSPPPLASVDDTDDAAIASCLPVMPDTIADEACDTDTVPERASNAVPVADVAEVLETLMVEACAPAPDTSADDAAETSISSSLPVDPVTTADDVADASMSSFL